MMTEDLSTVNPEEWVIAHIRLDSHLQIDDIKHLFKKEMDKIGDRINHWYFRHYYNPQRDSKDRYRYELFIWRKVSTPREEIEQFVKKTAELVLCEVTLKVGNNPDFKTGSILEDHLQSGGISEVYLNCLATKIRSLITEEVGKELNEDQMAFLVHMVINQFKEAGNQYNLAIAMNLFNNTLLQTGVNSHFQKVQ